MANSFGPGRLGYGLGGGLENATERRGTFLRFCPWRKILLGCDDIRTGAGVTATVKLVSVLFHSGAAS